MRSLFALVLVLFTTAVASAQVQSRPTDAPLVTAEREPWYVRGDPVQFAGNNYYRAGATIFFDGNKMIRTGNFNGIPLYADTTVEPYSFVLVPIGRGLMQPFERLRDGELAGTTGSRAPSFPVAAQPTASALPMAATAPTSLVPFVDEPPVGAGARTPLPLASAIDVITPPAVPPPPIPPPAVTPEQVQSAREHVWVEFRGQRWVHVNGTIPLEGSGLVKAGDYAGFPVYIRPDNDARIYLPTLAGLVTPYEMKR